MMGILATINERSSAWVTIGFTDRAGAPVGPDSVTYRIDCMTTGTAILGDTTVSAPGASFEVELTPDFNRIIDPTNLREMRRLTVVASYGGSDEATEQYDWWVVNLTFVN